MRLRLGLTAAIMLLASPCVAQQYDLDMRASDSLTGGHGRGDVTINRPGSTLWAGPQLDLSGKLGDTLSGGSGGSGDLCSQISCDYGVQSNTGTTPGGGSGSGLDAMRSRDSLR